MENRKNALFIICHDISPRFGCFGDTQARTPNIDRLSERGVSFTNHYCHYPLCGPSRASLFTGYRPSVTRRYAHGSFFPEFRQRMGSACITLPEQLRQHGYSADAVYQVYHAAETDAPSWDKPAWVPPSPAAPAWVPEDAASGIHYWVSDESFAMMKARADRLLSQGQRLTGGNMNTNMMKRWRGPAVEAAEVPDGAYWGGQITDKAVEGIETLRSDGGPFFLGVGYEICHLPWCAPKRYWDMYERSSLVLPSNGVAPVDSPDYAFGSNEPAQYYTQDVYDKPWHATPEQSLELLHGAYAAVSFFDAQVGRLLEALEQSGLSEDTVVVVTTDHGFSLGEHGQWGKHCLWDKPLSVPLLIAAPDLGHHGKTTGVTEHVDIYPTLCDLLGVPKPEFLHGESLVPLMVNPERPWKEAAFAWLRRRPQAWLDQSSGSIDGRSVRTRQFRFNLYRDEQGQEIDQELFDYDADPDERRNRIGMPEYSDTLEHMRRLLQDHWATGVSADDAV